MPRASIAPNTTASTSGIETMTMAPARRPRLTTLTARTMAMDSHSASMNSLIDLLTVSGWSATMIGSMPIGRLALSSCMVCSMLRPSASTSPPSRMEIDRPRPGLPLMRKIGSGGSASSRRT